MPIVQLRVTLREQQEQEGESIADGVHFAHRLISVHLNDMTHVAGTRRVTAGGGQCEYIVTDLTHPTLLFVRSDLVLIALPHASFYVEEENTVSFKKT